MAELAWGRRFLMCPPVHFGVRYEINPWMSEEAPLDRDAAMVQWEHLAATLVAAAADVVTMDPDPSVPDLVFTANAGIVNGHQFVPSHFRHRERQPETELDAAWFADAGFRVDRLPADATHEGAGDALPFTGPDGVTVLLSGHPFRSDLAAAGVLGALVGCATLPVALVDPRLYHLDMTFCPLDERHAICAATAWDEPTRRAIEQLVPEPLWLDDDEALAFTANSVVVGSTIVMSSAPPRVARQLERWGFEVAEAPMTEFRKAGGGCRCLTLALDVTLSPEARK